jgi:TonB family protein
LALEKLRKKAEKDHENTLKKDRALNAVKAQSAKEISASGVGLSLGSSYEAKLSLHFRKCISVPRAYGIEGQNLVVGVEVRLAETGSVITSKVVEASGNDVLDELALEGVKKCSPAPAPRRELVNVPIVVEVGPR